MLKEFHTPRTWLHLGTGGGKSHKKMSMEATHRDGDKATLAEHFFVIIAYRDNNRSYRLSLELKDLYCSSPNLLFHLLYSAFIHATGKLSRHCWTSNTDFYLYFIPLHNELFSQHFNYFQLTHLLPVFLPCPHLFIHSKATS